MDPHIRVWSIPGIYPYPEKKDYTSGIFIHKQNLALKELGADVNVIQPRSWFPVWPFYHLFNDWKRNKENARPSKRIIDQINVYHPWVVSPKPSRLFKKPYNQLVVDSIVKFLTKQGVRKGKDVIMAQWLIPDGYFAVQAAKRLGIGCAVEMQGDDIQIWPFQSDIHKAHALYVLENANLMLGCSDFLCNEGKKLFNKSIDIHTIYTGIDLTKFKPVSSTEERTVLRKKYGINKDDIAILNVGSAIARKGWFELFAAVSFLVKDNPSIKIIAASGGLKEFDLDEKAKEFGIENNLVNLGSIPNNELNGLYQACDIFCLPSHWEGLANVLCEAMSSGCAVITTAVSGHPEVVTSGVNGELVPPKRADLLKEVLEKVISSEELRKKYGINARKIAEEKIRSHEANAKKLLDLLSKIV